jgi:hypothetical protein
MQAVAMASSPPSEAVKALAARQQHHTGQAQHDAGGFQPRRPHAIGPLRQRHQGRHDGDEGHHQAGTHAHLGHGGGAIPTAQHQRAQHRGADPFAARGPGRSAPTGPQAQQQARCDKARAHLEKRRKAHQRPLDGQVGGAPDQPGGGQAGHDQARQAARASLCKAQSVVGHVGIPCMPAFSTPAVTRVPRRQGAPWHPRAAQTHRNKLHTVAPQ